MKTIQDKKSVQLLIVHGIVQVARVATKVFISAYILKITNNIGIVAIYFMAYYFASTLVFILMGPHLRGENGILFYRIGFVFYFAFFSIFALSGQAIVSYVLPLGLIYGFATGFYWLPYNVMKYIHNKHNERKLFFSYENTLEKIISVTVPLLVGIGIWKYGSYSLLFVVLAFIFFIGYFFSTNLGWEDKLQNRYDLIQFIKDKRSGRKFRNIYLGVFFSGFSIYGAIEILIVLLIYLSQGDELRLGIVSSLLPIASIAVSIFMGHYTGSISYKKFLWFGAMILALSTLSIILVVNKVSILVYAIAFSMGLPMLSIMQFTYSFNILDNDEDSDLFMVEYFVTREVFINFGRVLSFSLLLILQGVEIDTIWLKLIVISLGFSTFCLAWYFGKTKLD